MDDKHEFSIYEHVIEKDDDTNAKGIAEDWEEVLDLMKNIEGLSILISIDEIDSLKEESLIKDNIHEDDKAADEGTEEENE